MEEVETVPTVPRRYHSYFQLGLGLGLVAIEVVNVVLTPMSFTKLAGAFERHTGAEPYALPASWLAAKPRLRLDLPMNFATTNDIIGGNSGSPVVNRNGEIVGLVFDGNIHSLGGEYGFDESQNRALAVHSAAIVEALDKVYGAARLVDELGARSAAATDVKR